MCSLLAEQPHSPCRWSTVRLGNRVSTNDCKSFCVTGARNYLVASSCCEQATRTSSSSSTNCSSNWVDDKTSSSLISENNSYTQSELWSLLYKLADHDRTCLIRNTAYRARCASIRSRLSILVTGLADRALDLRSRATARQSSDRDRRLERRRTWLCVQYFV